MQRKERPLFVEEIKARRVVAKEFKNGQPWRKFLGDTNLEIFG